MPDWWIRKLTKLRTPTRRPAAIIESILLLEDMLMLLHCLFVDSYEEHVPSAVQLGSQHLSIQVSVPPISDARGRIRRLEAQFLQLYSQEISSLVSEVRDRNHRCRTALLAV